MKWPLDRAGAHLVHTLGNGLHQEPLVTDDGPARFERITVGRTAMLAGGGGSASGGSAAVATGRAALAATAGAQVLSQATRSR